MDHTLERNKQTVDEIGLNQKDFDQAAGLIGSRYVQHGPRSADGEYVVAHVYDVMQPVPDTAANQNGMF
ncbi:hypothetical protein [Kribbella sp. NBC_00359]|uniref:hypothetical protein n=1 Tax=Kribbella sp. NBC_00359 TaxID=2975966 RepID=UPI002E1E63A0